MKIVKQVAGIDVSKDTFHGCLGTINDEQQLHVLQQCSFDNSVKGFKLFEKWIGNYLNKELPVWCVMEATGVYYENLAYFLAGQYKVSVLMPTKTKYFSKSLDIKSKTDKIDAAMLCRIGLERICPQWTIPSPSLKELKGLCREYRVLKNNAAKIKVRLHALTHSYEPLKTTLRRLQQQLKLIDAQVKQVEAEIHALIKSDDYLYRQFTNIEKVKGISTITIATIVAETNAFACISNIKQLASYAGLDVMMNQSGAYSGKTRISKKGNSHIRAALYPPAMSAIRCNLRLKQFYQNLKARKENGKIGLIAVVRKMLIMIYTLWKKEIEYDEMLNVVQ